MRILKGLGLEDGRKLDRLEGVKLYRIVGGNPRKRDTAKETGRERRRETMMCVAGLFAA